MRRSEDPCRWQPLRSRDREEPRAESATAPTQEKPQSAPRCARTPTRVPPAPEPASARRTSYAQRLPCRSRGPLPQLVAVVGDPHDLLERRESLVVQPARELVNQPDRQARIDKDPRADLNR